MKILLPLQCQGSSAFIFLSTQADSLETLRRGENRDGAILDGPRTLEADVGMGVKGQWSYTSL